MNNRYGVGDKVVLCKADSVNHFRSANMTVSGVIERVLDPKVDNVHSDWVFVIRFDDGRAGEYGRNEIRRVR